MKKDEELCQYCQEPFFEGQRILLAWGKVHATCRLLREEILRHGATLYANEPTCGDRINRRAFLGSQILSLRDQVQALEKQARKTPPKTLAAERAKVAEAKRQLPERLNQLHAAEREYEVLRSTGF